MKPYTDLTQRGQIGRIKKLALTALAEYDLDIVKMQPLVHGENTTFRIDTRANRYVVRVSRPGYRSLAQISAEMDWLAAISSETDLVVPRPVANRSGAYVTSASIGGMPEMRNCVVFHWVYGRFQYRFPKAVHLERIGVATAILHQHARHYTVRPNSGLIDLEWGGGMQDIWDKGIGQSAISAEDRPVFEQVREMTRDAFDSLGYDNIAYGLIHSDLHLGNVLFAADRVNVIDFDDCGFGHYLNDLAITLWYLRGRPDFEAYRAALLRGYERGGGVISAENGALLDTLNASRTVLMALYIAGRTDHPRFRDFAPRYTRALAKDLRRFLANDKQIGARWE